MPGWPRATCRGLPASLRRSPTTRSSTPSPRTSSSTPTWTPGAGRSRSAGWSGSRCRSRSPTCGRCRWWSPPVTLACISNAVPARAVGNARWTGVRLADVLERAGGVDRTAVDLVWISADNYTDSIPVATALDRETLLVWGMNGEPLPRAHGAPVRAIVPGIYGMKNAKWIESIDLIAGDHKGYWQRQGWSDIAPYMTLSRFDVPRAGDRLAAGASLLLGGVAFAGDRGISRVEVGVGVPDSDTLLWMDADLAARDRPRRLAPVDLPVHAHGRAAPADRARHRWHRHHPTAGPARQFPQRRPWLARRGRDGRLSDTRARRLRRRAHRVRVRDRRRGAGCAPGRRVVVRRSRAPVRRRSWSRTSRGPRSGGSSSRRRVAAPSPTTSSSATARPWACDYEGRRWAIRGAIQYVRVENLPRGAIGPGLLGNGGAYYFQAADTFSYQFYLRALSAAFVSARPRRHRRGGPAVVHVDGRADIRRSHRSAWPQARLDGRLFDDMDGSLYQRAWDGVRVTGRHGDWQWRAAAVLPTQGTFEESANLTLDRVRVATADVIGGARCPCRPHALSRVRVRLPRHPRRAGAARQQRRDGPGRRRDRGHVRRRRCRRLPAAGWRVGRGRVDRRPGGRLVRPVAPGLVGARRGRLPVDHGGRTAVAARRHRLRLRRWRRPRRPPRDVLPDAAVGRSLRAVEHLRADERRGRVDRAAGDAASTPSS